MKKELEKRLEQKVEQMSAWKLEEEIESLLKLKIDAFVKLPPSFSQQWNRIVDIEAENKSAS